MKEFVAGTEALLGEGSYGDVRYPPGFPALLVPFRLAGLPLGLGAIVSSVVLVVLVWLLARRLGGPIGGTLAALLLTLSPGFRSYGALVMSDALAAALTVGMVLAASFRRWGLSGIVGAASAWVRVSHGLFLLALPRRRAAIAMILGLLPLALFNLATYGSLSGYDAGEAQFGLSHVTGTVWFEAAGEPSRFSNLYFWHAILFGRFGFMVPLLPLFAAIEFWHRRADPATRLAVGVVVVNTVTHLLYFFQSARFALPTAAILVAYSAAFGGRLVTDVFSPNPRTGVVAST